MSPDRRTRRRQIWAQLPFVVWLVLLWMLLWGQFTIVAFVTGVVVAIVVIRVFELPPVPFPGRINPWHVLVYIVTFLAALVRGSLLVAWQVIRPGATPRSSIIAVPLRIDDDLIMTLTAVTSSLIPGSVTLEADRDRRVLYLHVFGAVTSEDEERQKQSIFRWERRIVRAIGTREQLAQVRDASPATPRQGGAQER